MRFRSTILEPDGSTVTNDLDAVDEQSLHDTLHREGRTLLKVKVLESARRRSAPTNVRLSPRRLLMLTQALQEALDAGVPLLATFLAVAEQEEDAHIAAMLDDLAERVAAGQMLSDALAAYPRAFSTVYCSLVRAGEQSGTLPSVLQSVAGFLEWRIEIAGVVRHAMIYPLVVATAGYAMVLFMLSFVVPRLGAVISKIGTELPAASRVLIDCSGFVSEHILAIALGSLGATVLFLLMLRRPGFQGLLAAALSVMPVARGVVGTLAMAQFCRNFSVLLNAGLTMTSSLELGAAAVSVPRFRSRIDASRERIVGGARLGEAFEAAEVMPPIALSMVKVGEEAGRLPITFERLSRVYDREVKEAVKKALGLLEPIVTVFLGLVVGGVAVLVITTIYSALKGIGR